MRPPHLTPIELDVAAAAYLDAVRCRVAAELAVAAAVRVWDDAEAPGAPEGAPDRYQAEAAWRNTLAACTAAQVVEADTRQRYEVLRGRASHSRL